LFELSLGFTSSLSANEGVEEEDDKDEVVVDEATAGIEAFGSVPPGLFAPPPTTTLPLGVVDGVTLVSRLAARVEICVCDMRRFSSVKSRWTCPTSTGLVVATLTRPAVALFSALALLLALARAVPPTAGQSAFFEKPVTESTLDCAVFSSLPGSDGGDLDGGTSFRC